MTEKVFLLALACGQHRSKSHTFVNLPVSVANSWQNFPAGPPEK
jgi:hypothetical protein